MKIKFTQEQLLLLISILGKQIEIKLSRKAVVEMKIEHYIYLHTLAEVVAKLGKKQFEYKQEYNIKFLQHHGAALMLGCCYAMDATDDIYITHTLRTIISQIEQKL